MVMPNPNQLMADGETLELLRESVASLAGVMTTCVRLSISSVPVVSSGNSASRLLSEQSFSSWRRLQVGILYANYSISSSSSARGQQIHARLHTVIRAEGPNSFASVINDVASTRGYHLRVDGVTSPIVEVSWVDPPAATATNVSVFGTTGTGTMQQASVNVLVIGMCAGASMVIAVAFLAGLVMYVRRRTGCVHPQPAEEKETASSSSGEHELSPRRDKENAPSHALGQHQVQELVDDRRSTAEASPLRGLGRAPAESRRLAAPQLPSLPGFSPWSLDMCAEAACSQTPSQVPTQEFSLAFSPEAPLGGGGVGCAGNGVFLDRPEEQTISGTSRLDSLCCSLELLAQHLGRGDQKPPLKLPPLQPPLVTSVD
jgi:hypothetical protein